MRYIALLLVLFSTGLLAQTQTISEPDYSIKCPVNWTTARYEGVLALMAPQTGANDKFSENLNVVSQQVATTGTQSLDAYVSANITQLEGMGISGIQRNEYIAGKKKLKGYLITYTTNIFTKGVIDQKLWQVFTQFNGKFFVITYSSIPETFAQYLPQMEMAVATIVFK